MIRSTLSFAILAAAFSAQAQFVTIDTFATPVQAISVRTTGAERSDWQTAPAVFGGSRGIQIEDVVATSGRAATLEVGAGAFGSTGINTSSRMGATYGIEGYNGNTSATPFFRTKNDLSLPGLVGWQFEWLGNDKDVELSVTGVRWDGPNEMFVKTIWTQSIPAGGARTVVLDGDDLVLGGNVTDPFSSIGFKVNATGSPAADWGIGSFSAAVPEPASMAVLGLGLAALKRRRAKK